jgi:SAM-dependent methyltransferase
MTAVGTDVELICPICERGFDSFEPVGPRTSASCPGCGSRERHRALWLLFAERPDLLSRPRSLLHFAPEPFLAERLSSKLDLKYVTADLDPRRGHLPLDVTDVALPDDTFDAILCLHVLEHVVEDRRAMRELHRILRPGGWLIVMVPLDLTRSETYEDPSITEPEDRLRAFRQFDHVRLYSPDIAGRLGDVGFDVEEVRVAERLGQEAARRHALLQSDYVFVCHKRGKEPT